MVKLLDRVKQSVAGTASSTTLGAAAEGFRTFNTAGAATNDVCRYAIEDDSGAFEIGTIVINSATTGTRTVELSSNSNNALTLTGNAVIFATLSAADLENNLAPRWTTTPASTLVLANDGSTAVTLTGVAVDENFPVRYSWDGYNGSTIYDADSLPPQLASAPTINQSTGVTSLVGSSSGSNIGTYYHRTRATDGINTLWSTTAITLAPTTRIINSISPALPTGQTSWDFDTDGSEINLDAGATYTFTAAGQFAVDFEVFGAGGGSTNNAYGSYKGGGGGRTTGRTTLEYDQTYTIVVGGRGLEGSTTPSGGSQASGGDGGGSNSWSNAGGGDLSGLFKGSGDIATFATQGHNSSSHTPIAIAGGGGGSGAAHNGGIGGGTSGGVVSPQSGTIPAGGSQTAGGTGGVGATQSGSDGSYLVGGQGGLAGGTYTGSGGGGGYFGGGGGGYESGAYIQGAAGGAGYFNTSLVTSGVLTDGDSSSVALNYLDGSSQTSGKGAQNGSNNGTDGRVKLTKVT